MLKLFGRVWFEVSVLCLGIAVNAIWREELMALSAILEPWAWLMVIAWSIEIAMCSVAIRVLLLAVKEYRQVS